MEQIDDARVRRTVLQIILLVTLAVTIGWALYMLRVVLLLLAFTVIFCYLIAPIVDFINRPIRLGRAWRIPRALAILIVYLLLAVGIAFALERLVPLLSEQLTALFENFPRYATQIDKQMKWLTSLPQRYRLPTSLRQSFDSGINALMSSLLNWVQLIATWIAHMALYLPWLVLIPVIGFFLLKDAKAIETKLTAPFQDGDMRYRVTVFLKDVSQTLAAFIRAQLLACCLVGIIEGLGLWLIGIPYALIFAVVAGLLEFIPLVGPVAFAITAILVGSFYSWHTSLLVAGFLGVYRMLHDYVIYPRLLGAGMEIHPLMVILAVLCGAELGGVTGVFLSIPVGALLIVFWRHWRDLQQDRPLPPVEAIEEQPLIEKTGETGETRSPTLSEEGPHAAIPDRS
ncbi:MAG TPA: AI-2E family transporter [Blastocatellia bacterium]|nr:AI-2E family transporter [Blastocatellia bacterium]